MQPWWMSVVASLCGVTVGFALAQSKDWWSRRRRRKTHWAAIGAELEFCRRMAETYERDPVLAPLYRLPTMAYRNSLASLLADAALNGEELNAVMQFFIEAETLNRGLDLAQEARAGNNEKALAEEVRRNTAKARRLRPVIPGETQADHYTPARIVIDKHV